MNFNEYQKAAQTTAVYPGKGENLWYPTLGLNGEAGEVGEKVKKLMRDHDGIFPPGYRELIIKELGDVLWYVADIAEELGFTLERVAEMNIDKLASRLDRGTIIGSGDNR